MRKFNPKHRIEEWRRKNICRAILGPTLKPIYGRFVITSCDNDGHEIQFEKGMFQNSESNPIAVYNYRPGNGSFFSDKYVGGFDPYRPSKDE